MHVYEQGNNNNSNKGLLTGRAVKAGCLQGFSSYLRSIILPIFHEIAVWQKGRMAIRGTQYFTRRKTPSGQSGKWMSVHTNPFFKTLTKCLPRLFLPLKCSKKRNDGLWRNLYLKHGLYYGRRVGGGEGISILKASCSFNIPQGPFWV